MKCNICKNNYKPPECEPKCNRMCENFSDFEPITNVDMIRRMTDEELADFLRTTVAELGDNLFQCDEEGYPTTRGCVNKEDCTECYLKWLKTEVKEE